MATVPEPVPSAGILGCSGSICRPLIGTDRYCDRSETGRDITRRTISIFKNTQTLLVPFNWVDLPSQVWVHHLHLVLQLALVCPQQLESTTETKKQSITIFINLCSLADHMASCLEAGDLVPTVGQQVAFMLII